MPLVIAPIPTWMKAGMNAKMARAKGMILLDVRRPKPNALRRLAVYSVAKVPHRPVRGPS